MASRASDATPLLDAEVKPLLDVTPVELRRQRIRRYARTAAVGLFLCVGALAATVAVVVAVVVVAVAVCAWRRRRRRRQETYNSVELATKSLELSDLAVDESGAWIMDDVANPMR